MLGMETMMESEVWMKNEIPSEVGVENKVSNELEKGASSEVGVENKVSSGLERGASSGLERGASSEVEKGNDVEGSVASILPIPTLVGYNSLITRVCHNASCKKYHKEFDRIFLNILYCLFVYDSPFLCLYTIFFFFENLKILHRFELKYRPFRLDPGIM